MNKVLVTYFTIVSNDCVVVCFFVLSGTGLKLLLSGENIRIVISYLCAFFFLHDILLTNERFTVAFDLLTSEKNTGQIRTLGGCQFLVYYAHRCVRVKGHEI